MFAVLISRLLEIHTDPKSYREYALVKACLVYISWYTCIGTVKFTYIYPLNMILFQLQILNHVIGLTFSKYEK